MSAMNVREERTVVATGMPSLRTLPADLSNFAKYHFKHRVYDHPAREDTLGIVPLELDLDAYTQAIEAFADRCDVRTIAQIEHRGVTRPIHAVRTRGRGNRILVLAGVHGNEHAGLLAVPEIVERGIARDGVALMVITPVNPVGAAHLSRYNGEGYDINRDFVRFTTPEAQAVRREVEAFGPDFVVALHEGPQDATFFFANTKVDRALAIRLLDRMAQNGTELARSDYFGRTLSPPGYAPMSRAMWGLSLLWARSLEMKATGFYFDELGIPELTLESSWRMTDPAARVRPHVELVSALLDELGR
jgi:hypothetical protein